MVFAGKQRHTSSKKQNMYMRNTEVRTEKLHPNVKTLFGISKYKKGEIKIVPVESFEEYKPLMEKLDVSAFKVVKRL